MQKMTLAEIEKLVDKYIKENILAKNERVRYMPTTDGTLKTATPDQLKDMQNTTDSTVTYKKTEDPRKAMAKTMEAKKKVEEPVADTEPPAMDEPPVDDTAVGSEEAPSASTIEDMKAKIQDIVSKLETMDDFKIGDKEDLKAKKLINKVQSKLDDVLLSMDDLSAMKKGIDEQKEAIDQKEGDKFVKHLEKMMKKRFKNPADVKSVMDKYHATARKYKTHKPEKVAEAIVKHMLKEGFDPRKKNK